MTQVNVNETVLDLTRSAQEVSQVIAESSVEAVERNTRYVQSVLTDGMEVLKSHVESTRSLVETVSGQVQKPQDMFQTVSNTTMAAQERNIQFAQSAVENGIRVLQSHAEANRALTQELIEQARKQQGIFQTLVSTSVEAYVNLLRRPFVYYKQALDFAQTTTRQGVEGYQKATREGLETFRNVTRQAQEDYQNVAR
jgi:polyhydroxyalkanoate synthesis regulator phasin